MEETDNSFDVKNKEYVISIKKKNKKKITTDGSFVPVFPSHTITIIINRYSYHFSNQCTAHNMTGIIFSNFKEHKPHRSL
jgi:asparagine N-glycosylation enzyme membrane subunit Stt3